MWKKHRKQSEKEPSEQKERSPVQPNVTPKVSGGIAYTVVFDAVDGRLISTPTIKKKAECPSPARPIHNQLGVLNDEDEQLMAQIIDEVESKEKREKLEEKLMMAEIMREAQIQEKMEKARRGRKAPTSVAERHEECLMSNADDGSSTSAGDYI